MKQILSSLLSCWTAVFFLTATGSALASESDTAPDALLCLDSMETVPMNDDLEPTPIAAANGCMVAESLISI